MTELLPPGWWMKNANGSFAGPPPLEDPQATLAHDDDDDSEEGDTGDVAGLDIRPDSPGWEDMEADTEAVSVQCLLCAEVFQSSPMMLEHCKAEHGLDFIAIVKEHNLDFYQTIKYINLVRSNVQKAVQAPAALDVSTLARDDLLKPVLENDALLFTLDEILDFDQATMDDATSDAEMGGIQP